MVNGYISAAACTCATPPRGRGEQVVGSLVHHHADHGGHAGGQQR
jgi:hypothetical protein